MTELALTTDVRDIRDALSWLRGKLMSPNYLEIGVCEGGSLLTCINCLNPCSLTLVDNWGAVAGGTGRGSHAHIEQLLANFGYKGKVSFHDGNSVEILPTLPHNSFDLALVDGDHSEEVAARDLFYTYNLVKPGGWLLFDDLDHTEHPYLRRLWSDYFVRTVNHSFLYTTPPNNGTFGFGLLQKGGSL